MLRDDYSALAQATAAGAAPVIVELVFAGSLAPDEVARRIAEALPDAPVEVASAFQRATDRFHFASFPAVTPADRVPRVFAFARALAAQVGASEGNPVLEDSLYGAAAIGVADEESFLRICETRRKNLRPFGWPHPRIRTIEAWQHTRGAGSLVAVIDTGYSSHQELPGAIRQLAISLTAGCAALWAARHGGRQALTAEADRRGTTVQAMFVRCATEGLTRPPVWGGARDLGAGVIDAARLLAAELPTGAGANEAVRDEALPPEGVEPT
jgi:hypothetical protein